MESGDQDSAGHAVNASMQALPRHPCRVRSRTALATGFWTPGRRSKKGLPKSRPVICPKATAGGLGVRRAGHGWPATMRRTGCSHASGRRTGDPDACLRGIRLSVTQQRGAPGKAATHALQQRQITGTDTTIPASGIQGQGHTGCRGVGMLINRDNHLLGGDTQLTT